VRAEARFPFARREGESSTRELRVWHSVREEEKYYEFERLLDTEEKG
jgi:hypothetical protein